MKLNKQSPSLTFFCNYKKEQMKTQSSFCLIKRKFEIRSNLIKICNYLTQVLFLKHVSRNSLRDLPSTLMVYVRTFNKLVVQTYESVL